jgi:multidrug efflux system outer membrane protein
MGPDYERPQTDTPDQFQQSAAGGESIANLPWWELFNDENLVEIITIALEQNKDLAIAVARVEETRALLGFVRADQFPQLGVTAGAGRGNTVPGTGSIGSVSENYILAGDLSYEIDLWGKIRRSTEAARADLMATIEAQNVVTATLIADVASIYLLLLDLDERVRVAERTFETRQDSLAIIEARFERGIVPLIDVNQAQVEKADAKAELLSLQREDQQAENMLNVLLGRNPANINRSRNFSNMLVPPDIPVGLPSELLERRPDIRQAERQLAAQTARIGVAEALRFPSLSLTGTLGLASNDLSRLVSGDNKIWSLSGNLLAPVFDGGRNRSRVEAEVARTEQTLQRYELTILQAFQEVEDALVAIRTFKEEALARDEQLIAAQSAAFLSRARYDGGVTSYLEVLESERSLFRAELLASSTHREHLVSIVNLYKALGGGWLAVEEAEEETSPP